jgi:ferredoxin
MCLAVCPAEAISGSGFSNKSLHELIIADESPLVLSCRLRDKQSSWPCLGFLDSRLMVVLILSGVNNNRQIVIDNKLCNACKTPVNGYLRELINNLNQILVLIGKNPVIQGFDSDNVKKQEKSISRRNFFKSFVKGGVEIIAESMEEKKNPEPLPRQKLFSGYEKLINIPVMKPAKFFYNISFNSSCQTCGLCEKICPYSAINAEEQNGWLNFYHNSLICTGCDICAANCPQASITLNSAVCLGRYKITERKLPHCAHCGNFFKPAANQEICLECFLENISIK